MRVGIPRDAVALPTWYETITQAVSALPDQVQHRLVTLNATPVVILSLPLIADTLYLFQWVALARQTAGSGGTVGNSAAYHGESAWHLVSGTADQIGSGATVLSVEDDAGWAVTVAASGNRVQWSVTGASNQTIGWQLKVSVSQMTG